MGMNLDIPKSFRIHRRMTDVLNLEGLSATLPIQIADKLGTAIIEEVLRPGERIREVDFANKFRVSRATVRDALRILETRGLVRILPQRGAQVTLLSTQELQNLFEIRATLLGLASRRAAKNFQQADSIALRRGLTELIASIDDPNEYSRCSARMVQLIGELSRNEQLAEMIMSFSQRIGRYARLGLVKAERRQRSLANWKTLVSAITARDIARAESVHKNLASENGDAALLEIQTRTSRPPETQ